MPRVLLMGLILFNVESESVFEFGSNLLHFPIVSQEEQFEPDSQVHHDHGESFFKLVN